MWFVISLFWNNNKLGLPYNQVSIKMKLEGCKMNFIPGVFLILFVSMSIGLFIHLWRGGNLLRMIVLVLFAFVGFMLGHWISHRANSSFLVIGWVQLGWGVVSSIVTALVGAWLTEIKIEK